MKRYKRLLAGDGQSNLQLVPRSTAFLNSDSALERSVLELTRGLVNVSSQGGIDNQRQVISYLADWFQGAGISYEILQAERRKFENSFLGLTSWIGTGEPPFYLLTACLDTAPHGDRGKWNFDPLSARIDHKGRLYGRGSADSKAGVAIFSHLLADMRRLPLRGTIFFLADSDEHSGRFGAIKSVVSRESSRKFSGAFIGYPGDESIKSGARGFYRARIVFYGTSQHTGSSKKNFDDAIQKAIFFGKYLYDERNIVEVGSRDFSLPPKISITSIHGGTKSYSISSDSCTVKVDVRLTPSFQKGEAKKLLSSAVRSVVERFGGQRPRFVGEQSWPAYRIPDGSPLIRSLQNAATAEIGRTPPAVVCGPSNVGNYLASVGVDAVCGFGVKYEGIHAANEYIDISSLLPTYRIYKKALLSLVGEDSL